MLCLSKNISLSTPLQTQPQFISTHSRLCFPGTHAEDDRGCRGAQQAQAAHGAHQGHLRGAHQWPGREVHQTHPAGNR